MSTYAEALKATLIEEEQILARAFAILEARVQAAGTVITGAPAMRDYLRVRFALLEHEVFLCIWLDTMHRIILAEELFRGTLSQTSVYPREVVKRALALNAAAVIFAHNHPSGVCEPSASDETITSTLKEALKLVDVRVLDHFVVGLVSCVSFSERGLL